MVKDSAELDDQRKQVLGDGLPDDIDVDLEVDVNEAVAHPDDRWPRDLSWGC